MKKLSSMLALGALLMGSGPSSALTFTVTKTTDTNDGVCNVADCSLREAIVAANLSPGLDAVTVPAGTYVLTRAGSGEDAAATGDLDVTEDVILTGAGAGLTIIDGNATDQVVQVFAGSVTVSAVSIRRGDPAGISNDGGHLTVDAVELNANSSGVTGNSGVVTIRNSTISGNGVNPGAGGLASGGVGLLSSPAEIINTTISGNAGIAVFSVGPGLTMTNVTVVANAGSPFGAVFAFSGGTMTNTLLANNLPSNCLLNNIVSGGHNLDDDGSCSLSGPGDISGADAGVVFLGHNGGTTKTHALAAGSPALDAADNLACPPADQRGVPRPVNGTCDIGAFEGPPCFGSPDGALCDTDLMLCDGNVGTCTAGVCSVSPGDPCPGTECNSTCQETTASCFDSAETPCTDDGNPCTTDSCTVGFCLHPPGGNGSPCDDGVACNGDDRCLDGACFHSDTCPAGLPLDHYQCWQARDLNVPARFQAIDDLPVSDQFSADTIDVKKPALLCNPADQGGSGINDPSAHICCYKVKGAQLNPRPRAEINDQFGTRHLEMKKPKLLCQPCTKALLP